MKDPLTAYLDHLTRLADAATPGPWHRQGVSREPDHIMSYAVPAGQRCIADMTTYRENWANDAAFIAALDPETVKALVNVARAAQKWHDAEEPLDAGNALDELTKALDALARLEAATKGGERG